MRILRDGLTHFDEAKATPGFTLYSPLFVPRAFLVATNGDVVHEWDLPDGPGAYPRLLPNGNLFYSAENDNMPPLKAGGLGGTMRELDWDGNIVNEVRGDWQHHDMHRLPNGNTLYVSFEEMPEDRSALVRGGLGGNPPPWGWMSDVVRELDPDGNTVWEWHAADMDIENYPMRPVTPPGSWPWINAAFPLENGDVLISSRHLNMIAIIDRETKQFRWEMSDFSWGGQHDPQMLENGNIILFANGDSNNVGHPFSRVIEIDPETKEQVWVYHTKPGRDFYSHHISGQQRLWSGNTLICEGLWGRLFEVTPDGELVWEYVNPHAGPMLNGDPANWVFRTLRYAPDSPEIAGRVTL